MPSRASSPPPRHRSPSKRRSMQPMTPPTTDWATPERAAPPVPAFDMRGYSCPDVKTTPRLPSRPAYDVTSPRPARSSPAPALMSPPIINTLPSPRRSTLLPAIPLAIDTPTPPRPARRRRESELAPPQTDYSRSGSPSGSSIMTVTDLPTPRGATAERSKRDSTQRRMSALKGLIASIDFNQPWSLTDEGSGYFVCSAETLQSPAVVVPAPTPSHTPVVPPRTSSATPKASQDHGWSTPKPLPRSESSRRVRTEQFDVASSGFSKCLPSSPMAPHTPETTWRSTLSSEAIYIRLLELRGSDEIKRQEIMWEMCETEQAFLKSIRNVLRLFATPIKTPQGKWIDGIPERVSDLFDSLESLAHVHGVLAATQRDMRRKTEVFDINVFIRNLRSWVNKLEIYEWYLLKFEAVVALVEDHVRDPASVFGEFVRMQMKDEALGAMSLSSMLLKPVQRLMKYPLFLKRLLDVTPCHPELLSLLATTESIILTLQASKAKEEDFEQLISLEASLAGLPPDFVLAQRGRKLTAMGSVARLHPSSFPTLSSRASVSSSISSVSSPWDSSFSPSTCRSSSFSVSSSSSGAPSRTGSMRMSPSTFSPSPKRPGVYRSPSSASSTTTDSSRPSTPNGSRRRSKDELTLFVFDDIIVLATSADKGGIFSKSKRERGWKALPEADGGIGKVVEVKDWSGFGGYATLFTISVLPLGITASTLPVTLCLTIPPPTSPKSRSQGLSKCPILSSLPQFMSALSQATIPASASMSSTYLPDKEGEEVLQGEEYAPPDRGAQFPIYDPLDNGDHPLHSLRALGYAQ